MKGLVGSILNGLCTVVAGCHLSGITAPPLVSRGCERVWKSIWDHRCDLDMSQIDGMLPMAVLTLYYGYVGLFLTLYIARCTHHCPRGMVLMDPQRF